MIPPELDKILDDIELGHNKRARMISIRPLYIKRAGPGYAFELTITMDELYAKYTDLSVGAKIQHGDGHYHNAPIIIKIKLVPCIERKSIENSFDDFMSAMNPVKIIHNGIGFLKSLVGNNFSKFLSGAELGSAIRDLREALYPAIEHLAQANKNIITRTGAYAQT